MRVVDVAERAGTSPTSVIYGLSGEQAGSSRLAEIPEESYRRNGLQLTGGTPSR